MRRCRPRRNKDAGRTSVSHPVIQRSLPSSPPGSDPLALGLSSTPLGINNNNNSSEFCLPFSNCPLTSCHLPDPFQPFSHPGPLSRPLARTCPARAQRHRHRLLAAPSHPLFALYSPCSARTPLPFFSYSSSALHSSVFTLSLRPNTHTLYTLQRRPWTLTLSLEL